VKLMLWVALLTVMLTCLDAAFELAVSAAFTVRV
jgi:hypothetical protein